MAVTYTNNVKTPRMTATRDHFASGTLELGTAGFATTLATFTLSVGGGTVLTDTWTLTFVSSTVAAGAAGTAVEARMRTSGAAIDLTGLTVGIGTGDIQLDNNVIANGQDVTLSSATIQHAP